VAEFIPDEYGVTVLAGGHPQSHIPHDPDFLVFEYMRHLADALELVRPAPPDRIAVTHIGGAGLTLPRYVEHTRPGSPQIVLEPDAALTEAVRAEVPLPRGHRIRVRATTGEAGIAALRDDTADAVVLDAFAEGQIPAGVTTREFLGEVHRVLRPGCLFAANLADAPGLDYVRRVAATAGAAGLTHRVLVATHDVLKGRRFGNVVLVASDTELDTDDLSRRLRRSPFPTGMRAGIEAWCRGSDLLTEADPAASPMAPALGRWRGR